MSFIKIADSLFSDVFLFERNVYRDNRGFFSELHKKSEFRNLGLTEDFVQDNHSFSNKYTVRGLHYQWQPPMGKLIQVISGAIHDVIVDLRHESKTFGKSTNYMLTEHDKTQLWVPAGFAHGFVALEDNTHVIYKCTGEYNSSGESGINPLEFAWQYWRTFVPDIDFLIISEKDRNAKSFTDYCKEPKF